MRKRVKLQKGLVAAYHVLQVRQCTGNVPDNVVA